MCCPKDPMAFDRGGGQSSGFQSDRVGSRGRRVDSEFPPFPSCTWRRIKGVFPLLLLPPKWFWSVQLCIIAPPPPSACRARHQQVTLMMRLFGAAALICFPALWIKYTLTDWRRANYGRLCEAAREKKTRLSRGTSLGEAEWANRWGGGTAAVATVAVVSVYFCLWECSSWKSSTFSLSNSWFEPSRRGKTAQIQMSFGF